MHHIIVVSKQKNGLKKQSKGNFRLVSKFPDLNPLEKVWWIIKGELQKENISKRSILITNVTIIRNRT